jgi:predicted ATP-binding protein involved in virulence
MELVYLWVEKYKNIENQGFNFNSYYSCNYDETKIELTIVENIENINIFSENINITAIVGENGSGKSSLTDLILDLDGWTSTDKKLLFVVKNGIELKCYILNFSDYITSTIQQEKINRESSGKPRTIYSTGLKLSFLSLSPFLPKLDSYYANNIKLHSIFNYRTTYDSRAFHYDSFMQSILTDIPQLVEHEFINTFFNFKGKPKYFAFKYNKSIERIFQSETEEILRKSSIKTETDKNCTRQIDLNSDVFIFIIELNKKVEERKKELKETLNKLNSSKKNKRMINIRKKESIDKVNMLNDLKENNTIQEIEKISEELESIGTIDFFLSFEDSLKDEFHFSTGELVMLYYIRALLEINNEENDLILLIDECELFLHPAWQKKFINLLNKVFDNYDYKRQIIISSHSPFILSDIPKENVIFLEDGRRVDVNIDTFGANIHTLLSHGFFMQDGLIGEFAKEKINQIVNYLNDKKSEITDNETAQKFINIIGEPILKRQLQKMLDSKRISRMDEIDELKKRIELLESKQ